MTSSAEKVIPTTCSSHCGSQCPLKVHVKDGVITRIEVDEPLFRACARGRSYRQRVYAPDRLKYPMRRVGEPGEGEFERITWDEALDKVASELRRVKETYGPAAILYVASGGDIHALHSRRPIHRLLCLFGGFSTTWGGASFHGATFAELVTFGTAAKANSKDNLLSSRLILLWGANTANTIHHNTSLYLAQAREKGTKIISIDPRYTDTAAACAHQWVPIRPGTDTAMLIAMAYVTIAHNLQDQALLDTCTIGFDRFEEYVLGKEDGVPKTASWAAAITGVPATVIEDLAREYATTKPAALMAGFAPGRTAYGEQFHRAAFALAAMTGNIGIYGGDSGAGLCGVGHRVRVGRAMESGPNPVEVSAPRRKDTLPSEKVAVSSALVHNSRLWDAIVEGRAGGYPADYKLLYVVNSNFLNQYLNANKGARALKALEFIAVQEQFMTPTARFADILLPVPTYLERNDITSHESGTSCYGYVNKVIDPLYETKSHLEIATELAARLGVSNFNDKTEEELLREIAAGCSYPVDYDALKRNGIQKVDVSGVVAFKEQIENPKENPFPTPSGKIEIYSQQLADMNNPELPPIPKYIQPWEGPDDPLTKKYPLQLITTHYKLRALSQFDNIPWLLELEAKAIRINTVDAQARGIKDGDLVRVFNDRGVMIIPARVTERIMPGVVDVPQGAWYAPDEHGIDRGGCANVLTRDKASPGGAFPSNTALVQVEKV